MFYTPDSRDRGRLPHDPFKAIVAPRPIGWIGTRSATGADNLAPYSFFNGVNHAPPMVMFSSTGMKDSATNALDTRVFTWSLATEALAEQMNASCAPLPHGTSEFEAVGIEAAQGRVVDAPFVAASPAALECVVVHDARLRDTDGAECDQWLVVGQVVGVHLDEGHLTSDGRFDTRRARPLMRAGYLDEYLVADTELRMSRPH
ncbi:flavin reductase family protein [Nocardioides bruguierae]|uniref:Flavin reductase family protein n=1 Tax=Nocardioides bruguierae TaxID=2945102 RepID=A0A9X2IEH6_9ACTN|nr:flavin reductase family protein [Nocardioides bruguierae]MCM0620841.1 flavin reductase family protein [Nocardioides bruguierae]